MKIFLIPALLVVFVWSCSHKTTPAKTEMSSGNGSAPIIVDKPASTNSIDVTTASSTGAVASANSPEKGAKVVERAGAGNDAAAIAGQATYNQKCNSCHPYKITSDYTVDRWISVMQVMAIKAHLSDIEKENVLAYVKANAKR